MALINKKSEQQIVSEPQTGKIVDLMAALEASIKANSKKNPRLKKKA